MRAAAVLTPLVAIVLGCAAHQKAIAPGGGAPTEQAVVEATVNNNPAMKAAVTSSAKGKVFEFENEPYVELTGVGFADGRKVVQVGGAETALQGEVTARDGRFKIRIPLPRPLPDLSQGIDVRVGEEFHHRVQARVARLYGTVRFFDGRPVPAPIVPAPPPVDIGARGSEGGEYEILLPPVRIDSMAVWDRGYSVSSLETWLTAVELERDLHLDIRIGEMEVHSLTAWSGVASTTFVFFVPMSLARIRALMAEGVVGELELARRPEAWPHLGEGDVRVFFDQAEVKPASFREVEDVVQMGGVTVRRPAYLLVFPAQDPRGKVIKVEVQHPFRGRDREILERGEGFYLGYLSKRP